MLRHMVEKLPNLIFGKSLPPEQGDGFLSDLLTAFRTLPCQSWKSQMQSEDAWTRNMDRLRELVLDRDPRKFLRWDVICKSMFVVYAHYLFTELKYLRHLPGWRTRWRKAIKESPVGCPIPYIFYPASSGNLIHHAYHIAKFEEMAKVEARSVELVFEFGGGYGSMCRLFHNLGFRGWYIIFDLPPATALQIFFLKSLGLPVKSVSEFVNSETGIVCVSNIMELRALLADHIEAGNSMFMGTWSISESPISIRDLILPLVSDFRLFLIAYQDRFGEVSNVDFFNNWKMTHKKSITWHNWQITHIPGNSYLVGVMDE